jgi:hypothetical protein
LLVANVAGNLGGAVDMAEYRKPEVSSCIFYVSKLSSRHVPQVSSNTRGVNDIKQTQMRDVGRLLQKQREGLTNTTSGTANCRKVKMERYISFESDTRFEDISVIHTCNFDHVVCRREMKIKQTLEAKIVALYS